MKVFDYSCNKCGKTIEKMVSNSEEVVYCPSCDSIMNKLLSAPNVIFKGDGWCKPSGGSRTVFNNKGEMRKENV
jgi:putative FmdB family regulatory protein